MDQPKHIEIETFKKINIRTNRDLRLLHSISIKKYKHNYRYTPPLSACVPASCYNMN